MTNGEGKGHRPPTRCVVVTGLSGAGKSAAIKALEDIGFYCIDNLPLDLVPPFTDLCMRSEKPLTNVALGMDIRGGVDLKRFPQTVQEMESKGITVEILFLEARVPILVRRFTETRRLHPLKGEDLESDLKREEEFLKEIRSLAHFVLDTSDLTIHQLRRTVQSFFGGSEGFFNILLCSFGYKYGLPSFLDLMFDVRFLSNPYFINGLREKTGLDKEVVDYLEEHSEFQDACERIWGLLEYLLPRYQDEGKRYLSIGIGCTGGKHRSVAVAERLKAKMEENGYQVRLRHRDIEGEG
jgi:UPF0042 nucleotide-binding protein